MTTLIEQLGAIDAKLLDGEATPEEELRGQTLVNLANAAPVLKAALLAERAAHRQTRQALRSFQRRESETEHKQPNERGPHDRST